MHCFCDSLKISQKGIFKIFSVIFEFGFNVDPKSGSHFTHSYLVLEFYDTSIVQEKQQLTPLKPQSDPNRPLKSPPKNAT